jgi:hypothetical protein
MESLKKRVLTELVPSHVLDYNEWLPEMLCKKSDSSQRKQKHTTPDGEKCVLTMTTGPAGMATFMWVFKKERLVWFSAVYDIQSVSVRVNELTGRPAEVMVDNEPVRI